MSSIAHFGCPRCEMEAGASGIEHGIGAETMMVPVRVQTPFSGFTAETRRTDTLNYKDHEGTRRTFAVLDSGRSAAEVFSNPKGDCFWAGAGLLTGIGSCR